MALETLKGVKHVGEFAVKAYCQDFGIPAPMYLSDKDPIVIDHQTNMVSFKIQDGPVLENGINGCQVDTIIETARIMLEGLNRQHYCKENDEAIYGLQRALWWLTRRRINRERRGVEGHGKD